MRNRNSIRLFKRIGIANNKRKVKQLKKPVVNLPLRQRKLPVLIPHHNRINAIFGRQLNLGHLRFKCPRERPRSQPSHLRLLIAHPLPQNPINATHIRMKPVITHLAMNNHNRHHTTRQPHNKTEQIDQRIALVRPQIAACDGEIV